MATIEAPYYTKSGEAKGKMELPEAIFGQAGSKRILHEAIVAIQANQRRGTSMTKTRGLVSGGGRKPWKQKGTGNARSGSIRSPLWRGGGIIFGPQPRSYRVDLPAGKRLIALQTALSAKLQSQGIGVIDSLSFKEGKTKEAYGVLKSTKLSGRMLLVVDEKAPAVVRALRNVGNVTLISAAELNALSLLSAHQVLFTKAGLEQLKKRFPEG